MRDFESLVDALKTLKDEGYTYDFNILSDRLECKAIQEKFLPKDFSVDELFRFEGDSDPGDNSVLFAISTNTGIKGTLLDAYGTYSGEIAPELLQKLKVR